MNTLQNYLQRFALLSTDKSQSRWDEKTYHRAPHKPMLLLSVMDLFAEGQLTRNRIELTDELRELFAIYWSKVNPFDRKYGNIAMPFYHLQSDGFWHLLPRPGHESFLATVARIHAVSTLKETTYGARLEEDLFILLSDERSRDALRTVLIETYFVPNMRHRLLNQGKINVESFLYSEELVKKAKANLKIKDWKNVGYDEERIIRDQGFRRAIVKVYDHRCALCGIRIVTSDGHTAIAAAHIIPWSISHNDNPRNGLALCHLCHWTFDEGLVTFTDDYRTRVSPQLSSTPNLPGHLLTFAERKLIGPADDELWPFVESIQWHRQEMFRGR